MVGTTVIPHNSGSRKCGTKLSFTFSSKFNERKVVNIKQYTIRIKFIIKILAAVWNMEEIRQLMEVEAIV